MMSSNAVFTEAFTLKKVFKWTLNNFNEFNKSNMGREERDGHVTYVISSPELTAIDPYNGITYRATFELKLVSRNFHPYFSIQPDVTPWNTSRNYCYYYTINESSDEFIFTNNTLIPRTEDIKILGIFVDISGYRSYSVPPLKKVDPKNCGDRLKEMWKNDSSSKFTIECGQKSLETYKPILEARSFFFKDMFQTVNQNSLEITDFEVENVEKMVEFCETDEIKDVKGFEDGLFKIAHKLQIPDLLDFVVEKMSENANPSNIHGYLKLATDYEVKDFEEWCKNFAFRN